MNSLTDNEFDRKLDQMLSESVTLGAKPIDFPVIRMPKRPQFNWLLFGGAVSFIVLTSAMLFLWIAKSAELRPVYSTPLQDLWILLANGITSGINSLSSPTTLMSMMAIMAVVYTFATHKMIELYRYH